MIGYNKINSTAMLRIGISFLSSRIAIKKNRRIFILETTNKRKKQLNWSHSLFLSGDTISSGLLNLKACLLVYLIILAFPYIYTKQVKLTHVFIYHSSDIYDILIHYLYVLFFIDLFIYFVLFSFARHIVLIYIVKNQSISFRIT